MRAYAIVLLAAVVCVTTCVPADAAAPAAPIKVRKDRIDKSRVKITWLDASEDEHGFEILRRRITEPEFESRGTVAAGVTEFIDEFTPRDAIYIFRVRAYRNDEDSGLSNECYVNRPAPPMPIYFNARLIAHHVVRLGWSDRSNGERGFQIQRKDIGKSWKTVMTVPANTEEYDDYTLHPATDYRYRMRALGRPGICWADSSITPERFVTTNGAKRVLQVDLRGRGKGTVVSDPPGISCGPTDDHCSAEFPFVTFVTLIPKAKAGSHFAGWADYGRCKDTKGPCAVYLDDHKVVGAAFRLNK